MPVFTLRHFSYKYLLAFILGIFLDKGEKEMREKTDLLYLNVSIHRKIYCSINYRQTHEWIQTYLYLKMTSKVIIFSLTFFWARCRLCN